MLQPPMPGPLFPHRILLLGVVCLLGCASRSSELRSEASPERATKTDAPEPVAILSAHLGMRAAPPLGGKDALPVVFSVEVDPTDLRPEQFVVVRRDGTRVLPSMATLAPANEADENRTVLLVGEFATDEWGPTNVSVVGRLFSEDGRHLQGLGSEVLDESTPGTVVAAERVPVSERTCPGSVSAIRTYWIDGLRGVESADLGRIRVGMGVGKDVTPAGFDDHAVDAAEPGEDNVLDLCVDQPGVPVRLTLDAGAFADPGKHPSAAVEIEIGGI